MVPLRAIETASLLLRLTLLVAALTVALGLIDGRAALAGSEAQAVRGVEETRARYFAAYRAGDVDAMMRFMTDQTVLNTPLGDQRGRAAIRERYTRQFAANRVVFDDRPEEIEAGQTYAFIRGRYTVTVIPKVAEVAEVAEVATPAAQTAAVQPARRSGRYLVVLKRSDATPTGWAIHRELVQPLATLDQGPDAAD